MYLGLPETREKIADDIAALLPSPPTLGIVEGFTLIDACSGTFVSPNETVGAYGEEGNLVAETVSDDTGFYRLSLPSGKYFVGGGEAIDIPAGETTHYDAVVGSLSC